MPTKNQRVATYLPAHISEKLESFKTERNIKGDSAALIEVLSQFFNVAHPVAQNLDYSQFVTREEFESLLRDVSKLLVRFEDFDSQSDLLSELSNRVNKIEQSLGDAGGLKPMGTTELAKRLGMNHTTLSHWKSPSEKGKSPDELLKATREKDPDGIGWTFDYEAKQFVPEHTLDSNSQGSLLFELPVQVAV